PLRPRRPWRPERLASRRSQQPRGAHLRRGRRRGRDRRARGRRHVRGLAVVAVGFFINVHLGLAMIVAAPRYLPETAPEPGQADVAGALSSTLGMTALV